MCLWHMAITLCTYDHFIVRRDNLFVILLVEQRKSTVKYFSEPIILHVAHNYTRGKKDIPYLRH